MSSKPQSSPANPTNADAVAVKMFGLEIPVPHWAVRVLAVFVVVFVPIFLLLTAIHMRDDVRNNETLTSFQKELADTTEQLKDYQAKEAKSRDYYYENTKHGSEKGDELLKEANLIVTRYRSDGCVSVMHMHAGQLVGEVQWNKTADPVRGQEAPGAMDGGTQGDLRVPRAPNPYGNTSSLKPSHSGSLAQLRRADLNITSGLSFRADPVLAAFQANGKCLNPHPGRFTTRTGRTQGCWLQIWRQWPDGCTHYQWFNSCSSSWDIQSNGTARLYWTACKH